LEFSRRERIQNHGQKANDLVREAVGCNDLFGDPVVVARSPPACADHTILVPRRQNGPRSGTTPIGNHALHNGP